MYLTMIFRGFPSRIAASIPGLETVNWRDRNGNEHYGVGSSPATAKATHYNPTSGYPKLILRVIPPFMTRKSVELALAKEGVRDVKFKTFSKW